jgi:hypothetical protein
MTADDATATVPIDPDTLGGDGPALLPAGFELLAVPVPPMLEEALGYVPLYPDRGGGRWLAIGPWRADPDVQVWDDGRVTAPVRDRAWAVWSRHPACRFALAGRVVPAGPEKPAGGVPEDRRRHLVLDRLARRAYAAGAGNAAAWARLQWPAAAPDRRMTPEQTKALAADLGSFLRSQPIELSAGEINAEIVRRQALEARLRTWLNGTAEAAAAFRSFHRRHTGGQP